MSALTPRECAKRWAKAARSDEAGLQERLVLLCCAFDIELALRTAGEDTHWLAFYITRVRFSFATPWQTWEPF